MIYTKNTNCVGYTKDIIKCGSCGKKHPQLYDIRGIGMVCIDCFRDNIHFYFGNIDVINMRLIISQAPKKEKIKSLRREMNLSLRFEIIKRDNFKCVACGDSDRLEVDHIIPLSKGGNNNKTNLQTLCFRCNRGKFNN